MRLVIAGDGVSRRTLCALVVATLSSGYSRFTAIPPPDGGMTSQPGPIAYQPSGCDYTVTTPAGVTSTEIGGTVAASHPPDHVHAGFGGDPSTSFAVNWRSEPAATLTEAFFGTSRADVTSAMAPTSTVKIASGHTLLYTSAIDQGMNPTRIHEVHVCGLTPATTYFYKVGNPGAFSGVYSITTAPAAGSATPVTLAITGDATEHPALWALAENAIASKNAQFQIFTGGAVAIGLDQSAWNAFFETTYQGVPASDVMAHIPIMMTDGSQEHLSINYLAQFADPDIPPVPGDGKTDPKQWYSLNYGPMHITVLDDSFASNQIIAAGEAQWLDADLTAVDRSQTPWVIVVEHRPMYSCSPVHGSDITVRADWQPIFDKHQVDAAFSGQVNNYERSKAIRGFTLGTTDGQIVGSYNQVTMYVVAAGVGADLSGIGTTCAFTAKTEQTEPYVILTVTPATLVLTAYRLEDGSMLDSVTIHKDG